MSTDPQRTDNAGRDELGRFKPGHSGNPGGNPKGLARQARDLMPEEELVAGMVRIAKGLKIAGQKPTIAEMMRAREWLADRGHGKAPAFALIEGADPLERDEADRALAEVADELAARREARGAGGDGGSGAEAQDPGGAADGAVAGPSPD